MSKIPKALADKLIEARNALIAKKERIQEMEYQIEQLRSDVKFQMKRLNQLSFDTLITMGLDPGDYAINIDSTKLEKRPKPKRSR